MLGKTSSHMNTGEVDVQSPLPRRDPGLAWKALFAPRALPQHMHVPLISVPAMLGISRCTSLRVACRDWAAACSVNSFGPPAGFEEVFDCFTKDESGRKLSCMAILHALGAPDFRLVPLHVAEDHVHWLFAHERTKMWMANMLQASFRVHGVGCLAKLTQALRPRCKLPGEVLDAIFQGRSQASVAFEPLHYAILLSSSSLVRLLLSIATHLGACNRYIAGEGLHHTTVSPLLLAVLFADQDVVDVLRSHGVCLNRADAMAAMRLQAALLWADLEKRFTHLNLDVEAEKLAQEVDELRRRAPDQPADLDATAIDIHNM